MQSRNIDPLDPVAMPIGVMSPGRYFRKRREASHMDLPALAAQLVVLPWALRDATAKDVDLLTARLALVEGDRWELTRAQLGLVRNVIRIDPTIYEQLVLVRRAGPDTDLPIPSICKTCGCTWFVACVDEHGQACSWASADEDLCTACVPATSGGGQ